MDKLLAAASKNAGLNTLMLRKARGVSQEQLAIKAGIPRSTLTNIESGHANPSLHNLIKIAGALQVRVEELISPPRNDYQLYTAKELPLKTQRRGEVKIIKLLPDPIPGMEIDHIILGPDERMTGSPHLSGTKEYLYCIKGEITLHIAGDRLVVTKGDLLAFPGDQHHSYQNTGRGESAGFSVVALAY